MQDQSCRWGGLCLWYLLALLTGACGGARADDWPQFLGPNRNGISAETKLIDSFPESGPKQLWRVSVGTGMSGIAIQGQTACTLLQKDGQQWVIALNAATGESLWETPVAPEYTNSMGDGPRATPTIAGQNVCVYTGEGILAVLELKSGTLKWDQHPLKDFGGKPADYGMACSPIVVDNAVIVTVGAPQASIAAYDITTGKPLWHAGQDDTAGYSSPTLLKLNGRQQLVSQTGQAVLGLDPKQGDVLWRYPFETDYGCNTATPLLVSQQVFVSSGENHGSALLKIESGADVKETWTSLGIDSVLRSEWQTSLLVDGSLYGFDNVGGAGPVTHLTCINALTGERRWQKKRFAKGNAIAADGKLWVSTMNGELILVAANPDKFVELSRATVVQSTRQAPALANGRLYLRDETEIVCFDVRAN